MWVHNLDPVLFSLGSFEVRWYGLVYALGFLLAGWWIGKLDVGLKKDENWDLILYILVGGILGARIFEVFWEPQYYLENLMRILYVWQGGMSFHGGLAGGALGAWLFSRRKQVSFGRIMDVLSLPLVLTAAFGRIANFVNAELVGRVWNGAWCVDFGDKVCRHPSVLYSAVKRFAVFGWLAWLYSKNKFKPGFIAWNFFFWESVGRFVVDFFRQDVLYYGWSLGQWFSVIVIVLSLWAFWKYYREDWRSLFLG